MKKNIKHERNYKLLTINSIIAVTEELEKLKLKFTISGELFEVKIKTKKFMIQVDVDQIICWTNLSEDRSFNLCEYSLDLDEFIMELGDIVETVERLYKLKSKVDKHITDIETLINNSDVHGLEINDWTFQEMIFERIICSDEN